jgi:acyl-coenzyme A thioesterase PaaI-like protein
MIRKTDRHDRLREEIERNPFVTDDELAAVLGASIPTIRLDRSQLAIPEVRRRTREMAGRYFGVSRSLGAKDIVGEMIEIDPGKGGLSLLDTDAGMCLEKCDIVRGHVLFALLNSLAAAVAEAPIALTGKAHVDFLRTVRAGERLIAKARVEKKTGRRIFVEAVARSGENIVARGRFVVHGMTRETAAHLNLLKDGD